MPLSARLTALLRADPICIVDVGARGGLSSQWRRIRDHCVFVGFEPESSEAERLKRGAATNELYVGSALHRAETAVEFHHCVVPARSSVYSPDPQVVTEIYGTDEHYRIVRSETIQATTIDALVQRGAFPQPQFLKLDTQGSELDILNGGVQSLAASVVGIEIEVEFVPLYKGQPIFADVDSFLRSVGYQLMRFKNVYAKSDLRFGQRGANGYRNALEFMRAWGGRFLPPRGSWVDVSQLVYADAQYMRRDSRYLHFSQHGSGNPRAAIVKAVVLATEMRMYGYASDMLEGATRIGLIDTEDRADLCGFVTSRSRDLSPVLHGVRRQSARLFRRLRHPRSRK